MAKVKRDSVEAQLLEEYEEKQENYQKILNTAVYTVLATDEKNITPQFVLKQVQPLRSVIGQIDWDMQERLEAPIQKVTSTGQPTKPLY